MWVVGDRQRAAKERGEQRRTAVGGYTLVTGQIVYLYVEYSTGASSRAAAGNNMDK